MDVVEFVSRYFWVAAIFMGVFHVAWLKVRCVRCARENPDLADELARLVRGFAITFNIPWIVMAVGCTVGGIPTVLHFFRPRDGNPYVLAFFASVFLLWIVGTYWIFLKGGAELLARYPYIFNTRFRSPIAVKGLYLLCLAAGVAAVIASLVVDVPLPGSPGFPLPPELMGTP